MRVFSSRVQHGTLRLGLGRQAFDSRHQGKTIAGSLMTTAPAPMDSSPVSNRRTFSSAEAPILAHEMIQGPLARFTDANTKAGQTPPTAVLCHGILGSKRNMQTYARMIVDGFPSWQVLLVDLRCHGDSASQNFQPPHTVESSADDVLRLLRQLRLFPHMLIGHSYGGKVVMSMVKQFGSRLPRPIE
ncbi:Alpha/Beta hydrolase protein, partial [Dunaliella salina]